jgi:hypothetical protein
MGRHDKAENTDDKTTDKTDDKTDDELELDPHKSLDRQSKLDIEQALESLKHNIDKQWVVI